MPKIVFLLFFSFFGLGVFSANDALAIAKTKSKNEPIATASGSTTVSPVNTPAASSGAPAVGGLMTDVNAGKVWVKIEDGALSCDDPKTSPTLDSNQKKLTDLKIKVFDAKSANDGKMRAAMCGIPKGNEHHFLILRGDLKKAEKAGFVLDPNAQVIR